MIKSIPLILTNLARIFLKTLFKYPSASFHALLYFIGIKSLKDSYQKFYHYQPASPTFEPIFLKFRQNNIPDKGDLIVPNETCWNDYLVLAQIIAERLSIKTPETNQEEMIARIRWVIGHSLYNSVVHGNPGYPIEIHWFLTKRFLKIRIQNVSRIEKISKTSVEFDGVPISGIGGAVNMMKMIFDKFEFYFSKEDEEHKNANVEVIFRRFFKRNIFENWQNSLGCRICAARDLIQLEHILKREDFHLQPDTQEPAEDNSHITAI